MFDCKACGISKPTTEYRVHKKGYRIGKCRACERDYQRKWYRAGGERSKKVKSSYMAKRRAENPQAVRDKQNKYYAENREAQTQKMREYYARRFFWGRAMKLRGKNKASFKDLAFLWKKQKGLCALTGKRLDRTAQLDHITPKAKGGGDEVSNLRWVCYEANLAKRDMTDEEFFELCGSVIRWIGERIVAVDEIMRRK